MSRVSPVDDPVAPRPDHGFDRWLLPVALAVVLTVPAAASPLPRLTLPAAIAYALAHQPDYLAVQVQVRQAEARVTQAAAFPNPQAQAAADTSQSQYTVQLQQSFEVQGEKGLRVDMARQDVNVAEFGVQLAAQGLMVAVSHAYNRILAAEEALTVTQGSLQWQRTLFALTEARITAGELAPFERLRAQVQVAQAERDDLAAQSEVIAAKQALNVLIGRTITEPVQCESSSIPTTTTMGDVDRLVDKALDVRPEMKQAALTLARAAQNQRLLAAKIFPGMNTGLGYSNTSAVSGVNAMVQATVPVWYRQQGELAEGTLEQERLRTVRESLANGIRLQVHDSWRHLQMAGKQIDLYKAKLLPSAQRLIDQTLERFRLGDASGQELVEVRKTYKETQASFVQAVLDYRNAKSDLALACGSKEDL